MESLRLSPVHSLGIPSPKLHNRTQFPKLVSFNTALSSHKKDGKSFKLFTSLPTSTPLVSDIAEIETDQTDPDAKFDWYSQWYPVMPVCDLDKRVPHGKRVIGMDIVVWWDRNESAWKVFDDSCPHRLAPLSEGRIDKLGRLQCVYHGWCFNGGGDCKLIPQAPTDGPPVHTFKKACATVYPSTVQNDILWFWPNADPQYKDILSEKKPPYIPEIDDPSYSRIMANRDLPYSYEVLIENLMDPAHVPYAHYGIMRPQKTKNKVDREGGVPIDLVVNSLEPSGFIANREPGVNKFYAPCVYVSTFPLGRNRANGGASYEETKPKPGVEKRLAMVFICIPVSPGRSRIIWTFPRNFAVWLDKIVPRWMFHVGQNLILDSDLYLLHAEERKIMEAGGSEKWQKTCFLPTKSDTFVVTFRKWLNKYAGGQVDFRGKFSGALPPTPPREQLFDRYWSHVVNCSSCRFAYKGLNVLQIALQVLSFSLLAIVAATKQTIPSMSTKTAMVSVAILCFVGSKWLAHYIRKVFHFHDYSHALR